MDEVGVAGNKHEGADVGVGVGAFDAVCRHFDVDAVLDPSGADAVVETGAGRRRPGGHENGFDASRVEGGRVV